MPPTPLLALFYEYVPDVLERREPFRAAHLGRIQGYYDAGKIVIAGALGDPPSGALIVFRTTDPAEVESFAAEDPYVVEGLVTERRIEPWTVVAGA